MGKETEQKQEIVNQGVHTYSQEESYVWPQEPILREQLEWFQDQKLALMVHWGVYNQLGMVASWALSDEDAEWSRKTVDWTDDGEVFKRQYRALNRAFDPVAFQPEEWAKMAKKCGFRYLILTTKHHDGFCLWDTAYTEYKTTAEDCPFHTHKYVDIKRALYSNHLGMFQFFSDRVNAFLKTSVLSSHQNFSVLYGGLGSYWVFLLFSEKAFSTPTDILLPLLSQLKQDHLKYSFTPAWFTFDQLAEADILCKKGFEKYYFDLPYTRPENTSSPQNLAASMEQAVSAAAAYDYSGTIEHLEHCFSLLNYMHPSIPDVKKTFNRFVYSILNRNSNFIPAISSSKFTDYDILEHIENAESLSDLQKKIYFSVDQLIEKLVQSMQDKDDYVIQKAKEYIRHNYQDDLTLNDVATHVFLNGNYFSTLFKQKTGDTFRNYLRNVRIEKAKELLSSTNLRIYEIALLVGYNEHSHFVRAFKSVTGKSPGEFRESSS